MVQGYYTLEESAKILGVSPDELKQLARKGEIRSFQDRGTWRFRIQDIQEMARRSSQGSDLEISMGESLIPTPTDSPAPRSPKPQKKADEVFGFSLGGEDDQELSLDLGASSRPDKPPSSKKAGSSKVLVPPGSDSDIRLVGEPRSAVRKPTSDAGPKSGPRSGKSSGSGSKSPRPAKTPSDSPSGVEADSGVRLVGLDDDSDVRITEADDAQVPLAETHHKRPADSDIRLEPQVEIIPADSPEGLLTEEIDLDEELKLEEARQQEKQGPKSKAKLGKAPPPSKSPFDLSRSELELGEVAAPDQSSKPEDSSSEYDLAPTAESPSSTEDSGSQEYSLQIPDEDAITLADEGPTDLKAPLSGINLGHPADSGISLEQSEDATSDVDFELALEPESTPKPGKPSTPKPASGKLVEEEDSSSSEFELSLDADAADVPDSDSEFELTLDDAGGLAAVEEDQSGADQEKDIFETDFDVPGLEEESGSEAVAIEDAEADLESSDFDLDISGEEVESESADDVVEVEDELGIEEDAEAPPVPKRGKKKKAEEDEPDEADEIGIEEEELVPAGAAAEQPAPWGILPVAVLLPCVVVMVILGLMSFELVQTQQGYKPGFFTKTIGGLVGGK